jgi:hypothetical protein
MLEANTTVLVYICIILVVVSSPYMLLARQGDLLYGSFRFSALLERIILQISSLNKENASV